jgi:hypothetical protein
VATEPLRATPTHIQTYRYIVAVVVAAQQQQQQQQADMQAGRQTGRQGKQGRQGRQVGVQEVSERYIVTVILYSVQGPRNVYVCVYVYKPLL